MPINLQSWIEKNRDKLKPPVGNFCLYDEGGFLVMVIGGPNSRTDYHVNPSEELFYQVEGDVVVKVIDNGEFRDVPIREGELFLLPAQVPHSPQRGPNTIGLVVEFPRLRDEDHYLRWFCDDCRKLVHQEAFRPQDLGKQIKEMLSRYKTDETMRKCKACGKVQSV